MTVVVCEVWRGDRPDEFSFVDIESQFGMPCTPGEIREIVRLVVVAAQIPSEVCAFIQAVKIKDHLPNITRR